MATNVSEKDKTLQEVIEWCETEWNKTNHDSDNPDKELLEKYTVYDGLTSAYEFVIGHCCSMLGYSGSMPSEVPNQSEDEKMIGVLELLPHDMGLRVGLDTNETYYLKSGWTERCDGIYGIACGYEDCSEGITWFRDPGRIAIMNSRVKLAVPFDEHETKAIKRNEDTNMKETNR